MPHPTNSMRPGCWASMRSGRSAARTVALLRRHRHRRRNTDTGRHDHRAWQHLCHGRQKRLCRSRVGIDAEAGPTEIAILADHTADPVRGLRPD